MLKDEFKKYFEDVNESELSPKFKAQFEVPEPAANEPAKEVYLDSMSSIADVRFAAKYLGHELSDADAAKVYEAVLGICTKKDEIGAEEFEAVIASYANQVPQTYELQAYVVSSGNQVHAVASVSLLRDGFQYNGVAGGDGPIEAAFNAIDQSLGFRFALDNFSIRAITGGKESLGLAEVTLRKGDKLYTGSGLSTDIVEASIHAYVSALNQIFYEEG